MQKNRQINSVFKMLFSILFMVLFTTACGAKGRLYHPPSAEIFKNIEKNKNVIKKRITEQEKQMSKEDNKNVS